MRYPKEKKTYFRMKKLQIRMLDDGEITNCYHILIARFSFEMTHCMYVFVTQEVDYHYNSLDIIWLLFKKLRGF